MPKKVIDPGPEQVTKDVLLALELRGQMHEISLRHVLKLACWLTSNRMGKRDDCSNWSVGAAEQRRSWSNCPKGDPWPSDHGLIHDHIVPRKWIEDELYKLPSPTREQITSLLQLSEVCLVTEWEDRKFGANKLKQRMPGGWDCLHEKWKRYECAGIKIHDGPHPAS